MKTQPVDRSKVNEQTASAQDLPKSGFDLTYNSYRDYILGRIHVDGYHHIMPADKFSGSNNGDHTFNRLVTPMVTPIDVCQHNFFVTLRSIDRTFEDAFAPTALNQMSLSWQAPCFILYDVVDNIFGAFNVSPNYSLGYYFSQAFANYSSTNRSSSITADLNAVEDLFKYTKNYFSSLYNPDIADLYLYDVGADIVRSIDFALNSVLPPGATSVNFDEAAMAWYDCFLRFFIGEGSLIDSLGYAYLRRSDMLQIIDATFNDSSSFLTYISTDYQNEYDIRAYYAVWYEYFRDVNLEPVSNQLPKWRDFGSSSVVFVHPLLLLERIRSWYKDPYVSSMPDDIMRHVFAPIYNTASGVVTDDNSQINDVADAESPGVNVLRSIDTYTLKYKNVVSGAPVSVTVPVPQRVNDSLAQAGNATAVFQLDLLNLRNAQALERYLKRNFYFGDEYRDRMLAHYGSVISDYSVRRPVLLSSSVSQMDMKQEISPVNTPTSSAGDRTATATATSGGDGYEFFAEEFGIVLCLKEFMPRGQYAGLCPQNIQIKQVDYPIPEFSANNEEFSRVAEVACHGLDSNSIGADIHKTFGHHPYAHAYRGRVDEVHGSFLSTRQAYTFRRFFGLDSDPNSVPKLNYVFIHCHPNLSMFANTNLMDGQVYGRTTHDFYVERCLPTPVEVI